MKAQDPIECALASLRLAAELDPPGEDFLREVVERCGPCEVRGLERIIDLHTHIRDLLVERDAN